MLQKNKLLKNQLPKAIRHSISREELLSSSELFKDESRWDTKA
jgi:hypothetical protein